MMKSEYIDYLEKKDREFAEGVQEDLAAQSKFFAERSCPQHVIDERKVEEAIERMKDLKQMNMYDDEWMNWSGLR